MREMILFNYRIILLAIVSAIANNLYALTGSGTQNSPYFINNASDLLAVSTRVNAGNNSAYIIFLNNIDMSDISDFTPIGSELKPFIGNFDGNNHTISNLHITESTEGNYIGLFGRVGDNAIIKNVRLDSSCSITTKAQYVGGIVGGITTSNLGKVTISGCLNNATITSLYDGSSSGNVGSIIGICSGNTDISACANTGDIYGYQQRFVGGISGYSSSGCTITYSNCANYGTIHSSIDANKNAAIGGFIGYAADVTIENCLNAGKIDWINIDGNRIGLFAGRIGDKATLTNNYYNSASSYGSVNNASNSGVSDDFEYGRSIFKNNSSYDCTSTEHYARISIFCNNSTFNKRTKLKPLPATIGGKIISSSLEINLEDKTDFVVSERFGAKRISYQRNMGTSTWGTLCLPFDISSNEDVQFYQLVGVTDDNLTMTEVERVDAYTPTVFKMKNGSSLLNLQAENVIIEPTTEFYSLSCSVDSWQIVGTTKNKSITSGFYIARNQFWNAEDKGSTVSFPAYRAIFTTSDPQARAGVFNICVEGTTDISTSATASPTANNTEVNLLGQRVSTTESGIIIKNGRKVVR